MTTTLSLLAILIARPFPEAGSEHRSRPDPFPAEEPGAPGFN